MVGDRVGLRPVQWTGGKVERFAGKGGGGGEGSVSVLMRPWWYL